MTPAATVPPRDAQRAILHRLRRAQGQLAAIVAAVEAGGSCRDVVTQLAAVSSALDKAGFAIIATAMRDCVAEPATERPDRLTTDELERLFLMLA
ncbi:MAG: metal-sensitive transcriptional regulator [Chloroflexota bacterium]|jgi:DNA-binding FrmR family transcriptional regulator